MNISLYLLETTFWCLDLIWKVDGEIWYEACKDIPQGAELLVWYGDQYLQFMGIPVALKDNTDGLHEEELESRYFKVINKGYLSLQF